jgi:hypothetical protein
VSRDVSETDTASLREVDPTAVAGAVLVAAGLALTGSGAYLHFSIAGRASAGRCDGCDPWHPLFVLAPLAVGAGFVLVGSWLYSRR